MSEQEEGKEEGIDVESAARFYGGLKDYFKVNPKGLSGILHAVSENLIDAINSNGELRKDIGYTAGQLEVLVDILWNHDDNEAIQQALTGSSNLEHIMDVIARLAFVYTKIETSTEIVPGEFEDIIRDATTTLYKILEYIITDAGNDP